MIKAKDARVSFNNEMEFSRVLGFMKATVLRAALEKNPYLQK